jgi:hypothetical protein
MNQLASIDYDKIAYNKVQHLPPSYNGTIFFELLPSHVSASTSKNTIDGMDKLFNGHTWCHTITSNIHNSQGLIFRKSSSVGQLVCNNQIVTSCLDHPSGMLLSGQAKPTFHSN